MIKARSIALLLLSLVMDIDAPANAATDVWQYGEPGTGTFLDAMTADESGARYLGGAFGSETFSLGGRLLTRVGTRDGYVARLDRAGKSLWAVNIGGPGAIVVIDALTVDADGAVYVTGFFWDGDLSTHSVPQVGNVDGLLIKLDRDGRPLWSRAFGGPDVNAYLSDATSDADGNVYVTGIFYGGNLAQPIKLPRQGVGTLLAAKFDASGELVWIQAEGAPDLQAQANSIAADSVGNAYVAGTWIHDSACSPPPIVCRDEKAFLLKLDSSGRRSYLQTLGAHDGSKSTGNVVEVDRQDNLWFIVNGYNDATVTKRDPADRELWIRRFSSSRWGFLSLASLAFERDGRIYLGGSLFGTTLDPPLRSLSQGDAMVIALDADGHSLWGKTWGGNWPGLSLRDIVAVGEDAPFVSGQLYAEHIDSPPLQRIGLLDGFVFGPKAVLTLFQNGFD